jgi:hypothetical protein
LVFFFIFLTKLLPGLEPPERRACERALEKEETVTVLMLDFRLLTLDDIHTVRAFLAQRQGRLCDYTIGGIFMWRDFFKTHVAIENGSLYFKVDYLKDTAAFSVPVARNVTEAVRDVLLYCKSNGIPPVFCTVAKEDLSLLYDNFHVIKVSPERDWFDYLYDSRSMVAFEGRKYNRQRNHVNRFQRLYPSYRFEPINSHNIDSVIKYLDYFNIVNRTADPLNLEERKKTFEVFENYDIYNLSGGLLAVEDRIAAISVGEVIGDTLYVHIEKANREYQGVYQTMVNEFAKYYVSEGVRYINREEDVGDIGLRTSKMSYHPIALLEKYTVEVSYE